MRASAPAGCSPRGLRGVDLFLQGLFLCRERGFITFAEPMSASSGRWTLVRLQGEPLSLYVEQEVDQELPYLFCVALTHPFRSEGGVEGAMLPSVGASSDTSDELLSGKSEWRPVPRSLGVG